MARWEGGSTGIADQGKKPQCGIGVRWFLVLGSKVVWGLGKISLYIAVTIDIFIL